MDKDTKERAPKRNPTYYAQLLKKELDRLGVNSELEHFDGKKHVDLYIPESKLIIEVDGRQHSEDLKQAWSDLKRTKHSLDEDDYTLRLSNSFIYSNAKNVAREICDIHVRRKDKIILHLLSKSKTDEELKKISSLRVENERLKLRLGRPQKNNLPEIMFPKPVRLQRFLLFLFILFLFAGSYLFYIIQTNDRFETVLPSNELIPELTPAPIATFPTLQNSPSLEIPQKSIDVLGGTDSLTIKNNQQTTVVVNVTYRIYSPWFGADYTNNKLFTVESNSEKSFKVYDNVGCANNPCSIEVIDYSILQP